MAHESEPNPSAVSLQIDAPSAVHKPCKPVYSKLVPCFCCLKKKGSLPLGDRSNVRIVLVPSKNVPGVRRLDLFEILLSEYLETTDVQVVTAIFWSPCVGTTPNSIVARVSYILSSSFNPATLSPLFLLSQGKSLPAPSTLDCRRNMAWRYLGHRRKVEHEATGEGNATAGCACFCFMFRVGVRVSPNPAAGSSLCAVALSHSHTRNRGTFSWDLILTPQSPPCQNHSRRRICVALDLCSIYSCAYCTSVTASWCMLSSATFRPQRLFF